MREKYTVGWEVATAWTHLTAYLTTAIADETCLLQPVWLSRALAQSKAISVVVPQLRAVPGLYLQLACETSQVQAKGRNFLSSQNDSKMGAQARRMFCASTYQGMLATSSHCIVGVGLEPE